MTSMMITIMDARAARGYDACDHLVCPPADNALSPLIGSQYRTLGDAIKAVRRKTKRIVELEYRISGDSKDRYWVGC